MSLLPLGILSSSGAGGSGAFELIATAYGTGSSGTVTFASIPSTFKHLQIRMTGRNTTTDTTGNMLLLQFNSDTTNTNYKSHRLYGQGSSVGSDDSSSAWQGIGFAYATSGSSTTNAYSANIIDIFDYSVTTKYKTAKLFCGFHVADYKQLSLDSGLWLNTAAISSLTIETYGSESFTSGSRFSLYGVKGS